MGCFSEARKRGSCTKKKCTFSHHPKTFAAAREEMKRMAEEKKKAFGKGSSKKPKGDSDDSDSD